MLNIGMPKIGICLLMTNEGHCYEITAKYSMPKIGTAKNSSISHVNEISLIRLVFYKESKYMLRIYILALKL
jgi:hypothetical protein